MNEVRSESHLTNQMDNTQQKTRQNDNTNNSTESYHDNVQINNENEVNSNNEGNSFVISSIEVGSKVLLFMNVSNSLKKSLQTNPDGTVIVGEGTITGIDGSKKFQSRNYNDDQLIWEKRLLKLK